MERRLTAVLTADVVTYSCLMRDDEEATLSTLNTYRRVVDGLIENHRGRIFDRQISAPCATVVGN